ncbi:MAG: tryptophan--tRNA ligase [Spirochaetia bacterium]|nr:tryptophan--tRNA ligase [Spirochaetia bacterium]
MPKRVLSGMQPTGRLHLGHYLGVLKNYVKLQEKFDCYFMAANWHSMTAFYHDYAQAHNFIAPMISDWLAAGLDPEKSVIFVQSDVPYHAELCLILSMYTPVSWLERNPTYKEKQENVEKDIDSYGFLGYPVLQAADIFLYRGQLVPIGEDQLPHLELSREIARRFNHINKLENANAIIEPEPLLSPSPKVVGTDGRKMSKSYGNTLSLSEDENDLRDKIKKMKTDTARIKRTDKGNPENCPVFSYYDYFLPDRKTEINSQCRSAGIGCIDCKMIIADKIIMETLPFREYRKKVINDSALVQDILQAGADRAKKTAGATMENIRNTLGINKPCQINV